MVVVVCAQEIDWMFEQEQERVYNKLILKLFSVSQTWRWKKKIFVNEEQIVDGGS
jgi:hypothetical protein